MKRVALLVILCLLGSSPAVSAEPERDVAESAIEIGGVTFSIRTAAKKALVDWAQHGWVVHYTVRRNGRFMHPAAYEGGRFVGCRYPSEPFERCRAAPFPDAQRPIGWLLRVGEACGNAGSGRYRLIVPRPWSTGDDERWEYVETTFPSKFEPEPRRVGDTLEIWGVSQDWGRGGSTAMSIFVPFRLVVRADGSIHRPPLDPDLSTWPKSEYGSDALSRFVAGLRERNPGVMRSAKAVWTQRPPKMWQDAFGLATDDESLDALIDAVEKVARAKARLAKLLSD